MKFEIVENKFSLPGVLQNMSLFLHNEMVAVNNEKILKFLIFISEVFLS